MKTLNQNKSNPGLVDWRYRGFLRHLRQPYILINCIFFFIIALVFLYSAIYSPKTGYPIHAIASQSLSSTGLSRAFSMMLRFHFSEAIAFNRFVIPVFGFFLFQLIARILFSIIYLYSSFPKNRLLSIDIIVSVLLFLCGFGAMVLRQMISSNNL